MTATRNRQLSIALAIYLAFTLLFALSNQLSYVAERETGQEALEDIAGMLLGFVAFPIFCIGLPLWLARRWGLEYSFWPRVRGWLLGLGVTALYVLLMQQQSIERVVEMGIPAGDFLIHFVSTTLFHISYYPLFVVFLMPIIRRRFGLATALLTTSALFALFHLAGFHYFPEGVTLRLQVLLFASFLASQLLYLWTQNLILVALAHNVGGSLGLVVNGTLFNQADGLLIITAIIMAGLFAYMIFYEIRHRRRELAVGWYLQMQIGDGKAS